MANYGAQDYTNFRGVRVRGNVGDAGGDPGALRFVATSAFEGTMAMSSANTEASYAYTLPAKTGGIPITGTFAVQLGVVASGYLETMVTVSGLRREDAFLCAVRDLGGTTVTASTRTYPILIGARPENGYAYLTFGNPAGTSTVFTDLVMTYTTFR